MIANNITPLLVYILIVCLWAWLVAVNPFKWKVFTTSLKSRVRSGKHVFDMQDMDQNWDSALARLALLSDKLAQGADVTAGQSLNLRSRRQVSSMMGEIARDLEVGKLRIQRYSGFMWAKIAANFSVYFANERSRKPINFETVNMINSWMSEYKLGVQKRDIRLCHASVANLVFITETGELPRDFRTPARLKSLNANTYKEFKQDIKALVSGAPSNLHGKSLDRILDEWAPRAISSRDPYLYLLLVYLNTYRRTFNSLHKYAVASHDKFILLDYMEKMSKIQILIMAYVNALLRGDMLKQYQCCLDFATLAQIATGKDKYLINRDYLELNQKQAG